MAKRTTTKKPVKAVRTVRKTGGIDQYAPLACPRCAIEMRKLKKQDVVLDICPRCKGMWADYQEIDKLAALRRRQSP